MGRAAAITEIEYEEQQRDIIRVVSARTLELWSFAAGLPIGSFILFSAPNSRDFVCQACVKRGVDVRPDFSWIVQPANNRFVCW